ITHRVRKFTACRALSALLCLTALIVLVGVVGPARAASPADDRFLATELPDSPAGRQMQWLLDAPARLPLSERELRAHLAKDFLAMPGYSPAQTNQGLGALFDANGMRLQGLVAVQPRALVAVVTGRDGRELAVTLVVDRRGLIAFPTGIKPTEFGPAVALPAPTGGAVVGSDVIELVDQARAGRRVMLTRWYPALPSERHRPPAAYASPRLRAVIGALPHVRVHARAGARAARGRLPVVLFSPGGNTSRILYQALAEDLASHGYLVIAVDHGEAPVELPNGRVEMPAWWTDPPKPAEALASIGDAQATRVADMQLT